MGFANSTEITVYADDAYHYSVVAEDMGCCINYYEQGKPAPFTHITFGNMKEMEACLLYTSPSPRDRSVSRMPSSA